MGYTAKLRENGRSMVTINLNVRVHVDAELLAKVSSETINSASRELRDAYTSHLLDILEHYAPFSGQAGCIGVGHVDYNKEAEANAKHVIYTTK